MEKVYLIGRTGVYANEKILVEGSVVFGRDSNVSNLIYPKEEKKISGMHCKIELINGAVCLTDLGSTNGTFLIDGTKLISNMPRVLTDGEGFYLVNRENAYDIRIEKVKENTCLETECKEKLEVKKRSKNVSKEQKVSIKSESKQVKQDTGSMMCPKCGSNNCQIVQEVETKGKDFSIGKGCCGVICLGPFGLLCGLCGKGKQMETKSYWVCMKCGNKFKG